MTKGKWLIAFIGLLILAGLGSAYLFLRQSDPAPTLVQGTNTNTSSYTDKDFATALQDGYPDNYRRWQELGGGAYPLPGLQETRSIARSGKEKGKVGTATDMTPQGLVFVEDKYLLVSAYSKSKQFQSVIWVIDQQTGGYLKTLVLDDADHVGGLAYDDQHQRVWVATVDKGGDAQTESLDLATIEAYDFNQTKQAIAFDHSANLSTVKLASYMTYHDGSLYVGYFDQKSNGVLGSFSLDSNGLPIMDPTTSEAQPVATWPTYDRVQGITFYQDKILLSQSYGNVNSQLLIFNNTMADGQLNLDQGDAIAKLDLPPYLEQTAVLNGQVYFLFESAAKQYRQKLGLMHMDRVIPLSIVDLLQN